MYQHTFLQRQQRWQRDIDVLTYDIRNAIANQWALSVVCESMNDNALFDRRAVVFIVVHNKSSTHTSEMVMSSR